MLNYFLLAVCVIGALGVVWFAIFHRRIFLDARKKEAAAIENIITGNMFIVTEPGTHFLMPWHTLRQDKIPLNRQVKSLKKEPIRTRDGTELEVDINYHLLRGRQRNRRTGQPIRSIVVGGTRRPLDLDQDESVDKNEIINALTNIVFEMNDKEVEQRLQSSVEEGLNAFTLSQIMRPGEVAGRTTGGHVSVPVPHDLDPSGTRFLCRNQPATNTQELTRLVAERAAFVANYKLRNVGLIVDKVEIVNIRCTSADTQKALEARDRAKKQGEAAEVFEDKGLSHAAALTAAQDPTQLGKTMAGEAVKDGLPQLIAVLKRWLHIP